MTNNSKTQFSTQEYDAQFQVWKKNVWNVNKLKQKCYAKSTLIKKIKEELLYLRQLSANDYELLRKWYELQDFSNKYTPERLSEVYNRIWKPVGYSDFRRVEPELIYVRDKISSQQIDIWGNISEKHWDINDPLSEEWDILRTLVSRHRNSGVIGKQHRYLVRDKGTKKYLGVICISVDMLEPAGRDAIIGWTKDQKKRTQPHCANGSTIVPTSPFAGAFNGGKLLSLLCLSDEIADRWASDVGKDGIQYILAHVMTTSLFGNNSKQTMYDNLDPYWIRTPAETSGNTPYELSPKLEHNCKNWLYINEPRIYFDNFVAKKKDGSLKIRDPKDKAFRKLFSILGIKPGEYMSGHKRGMYLAPLYSNAYPFLREEIKKNDLIKKFDNSIEALTKEWKFGLSKNSSGAKARLEMLLSRQRKDQLKGKPVKGLPTYAEPFWYRDILEMSWAEVKEKYGDKQSV
jgi:hypothetical protein